MYGRRRTGVSYLFRANGSVLGIAISTSILQQSLKKYLERHFTGKHGAEIVENIRRNVDYIKELKGPQRAAAIEAVERGTFFCECEALSDP